MSKSEFPPIPMRNDDLDARNYHFVEIDASDPRGAEALIDIGEHGVSVLPYYYVSDGSNAPYGQRIDGSLSRMWCREGLLPMLRSANQRLSAFGCELVVYDAYRPIATQRGLWAWALEKVRRDHPALSRSELEALTSQYSSDPRRFDPGDATKWPIHSSGASVDVMLRSFDTGKELDLEAAFDDLSPVAHTCCSRLAEKGARPHQIMTWSGHESLDEVERYTKEADKKRMLSVDVSGTQNVQVANT